MQKCITARISGACYIHANIQRCDLFPPTLLCSCYAYKIKRQYITETLMISNFVADQVAPPPPAEKEGRVLYRPTYVSVVQAYICQCCTGLHMSVFSVPGITTTVSKYSSFLLEIQNIYGFLIVRSRCIPGFQGMPYITPWSHSQ